MASVTEVRSKQRAVIEFLLAENQSITGIHRRLQNIYGDLAVDKSTLSYWMRSFFAPYNRQLGVEEPSRNNPNWWTRVSALPTETSS